MQIWSTRLPEVAKSIGKGIFEFKKGFNDMGGSELKQVFNIDEPIPAPQKEDVKETVLDD
ncbi:hypothetical protein AGMMS50229_19600 [Campylobacterota bacterium]|nr:hypothetical protein AGMMS50229_19600 [Campylobacterota bacterium]